MDKLLIEFATGFSTLTSELEILKTLSNELFRSMAVDLNNLGFIDETLQQSVAAFSEVIALDVKEFGIE